MACQLLDLLPGEFRGRQGGPRVLSEAVLVCLRRQKCLLFGEFRMLASHRGLAPTSKEVCSHQMPLWTGAAVGGASHAQFSCKVKSTGLCLTVAARSEASLAPRGSPDAQRGGEVCSWKGLGESPGCPPALFSFGVCLGFVRGSHPSTSRRARLQKGSDSVNFHDAGATGKQTCLHGNRRVTSPNSIHRSVLFF